ncbi:MAG: hypothetical protein EZS28_042346 [Streblomastix strix]|uniref:Uncharacterized protein n=1 Tax=Streblomastix strix TaxID=222440 RepID=A0A5J4TVE3_9EUKA|nr:MAG: hypothetical protein EZS28_042346 [Streblomastix strix]
MHLSRDRSSESPIDTRRISRNLFAFAINYSHLQTFVTNRDRSYITGNGQHCTIGAVVGPRTFRLPKFELPLIN